MTTQHKLSATGKLAVVIGLAYAAPAFAANIEAIQGNAQVSQQNGVDIVNIVKPNQQGLSHNQYDKYNVSQSGAVLNNALQAGQSQLAGALNANSNFNGKAAEVILNEVVSKNPSLILGQQEVFGMAADYVLANPNGITYNGGNIINAPRASLVVGTPEVANGKLEQFNTNNANALNITGKVGGVSILDLVAPKVIANAQSNVSADKQINVVSGANKVGYTNGKIEKLERAGDAPVLDGQIFGSMNAGSIRIHATDDRATQTIEDANISADKELTTNIAGDLQITSANVSGGDVQLNAKNTIVDGKVSTQGSDTPEFSNGKLSGNVKFTKQSSGKTESFTGSNINATGALNLNNSGNVQLTGANISAGSLNIDAQNVNADSVVTTDTSSEIYRRSKFLWHNQTSSANQDQTVHINDIDVDGDARINAKNQLTLEGANLVVGKDAKLAGSQSIRLSGKVATDKSENGLDIRNESGKLKTGTAARADVTQTFAATNIFVGGDLGVQTQGSLNTEGAKIFVKGDALVDADRVNLGTATTQNSNAVSDQFKYWGGIGGGKEDGKTYTKENLQVSSLLASGNLLIGAKNGVNVAGSVVQGGKGALVNAGSGSLNVTAATTNTSTSEKTRTGTIFNITKSSVSKNSNVEVVTGSRLESDTNLQLASQEDVNVLGSTLKAADNLGIKTAGNLNIGTVAAKSDSVEESFAIKGFTEGNATASASLKEGKVVAEATGGLGLRFHKDSKETQTTDQVGSSLDAGKIDLTSSKDANISGSNVNATGDVNVNAQNVTVTAAQDVTVTKDTARVTEIGVSSTAGVTDLNPKVSNKLSIGSEYESVTTTNGTAQVSNITGANVNVTADKNITHEGTNVTASNGSITQSAETITNDVANNTSDVNKTHHSGGIFISSGVSKNNGVEVAVGIHGKGGTAQGTSNTAVSGNLNASEDVTNTANTVTDVATNYDAGNNVTIAADQYSNKAAASNSNYTANQGGASLTVSANTKDLENINVNAGLKVNYDHLDTQSSNATIGNIKAGNVSVTAKDSVDFASNVNATNNVNITSKEGDVNLTQANNTVSTTKAGVDVALNVGAKVNVSGAVIPKGGAGVEVTYGNDNKSKGTAGVITANGDVNVTANDKANVNVNGASIISEGAVKLSGGEVNSTALTHTNNSLNVAAGGKFSLGTGMVTEVTEHTETHLVQCDCEPPREVTTTYTTEEKKLAIDSVSVGAHADVVKENGVSHTANQIVAKGTAKPEKQLPSSGDVLLPSNNPGSAGGLTINANNVDGKGINLTGTDVVASTANLTAAGGDVNLNSAQGSLKRTGGGAGLTIEGDIDQDGFKPTAGSAYVNVDLANNKTVTGSSVKANSVNITSPGDLNLNSSTVVAQNVNATVAGDVNITSEQNVVDETKVYLAAAGGKGIDPKSLTKTENVTTTQTYEVVRDDIAIPTKVVHNTVTQQQVVQTTVPMQQQVVQTTVPMQQQVVQTTVPMQQQVVQTTTVPVQQQVVRETTVPTTQQASLDKILPLQPNQKIVDKVTIPGQATVVEVDDCGCTTVTPGKHQVDIVTVEETNQKTSVDLGKVAKQVASDLQNGTIMGVKAEAKVDVHVNKSKTSQEAGITATNLNVNAGGDVNLTGATVQHEKGTGFGDSKVTTAENKDSSKKFDLGIDVSTNVPKMVSYGVQHVTTGTSPLFNASYSSNKEVVASSLTQAETPVEAVVKESASVSNSNDPLAQQPVDLTPPAVPPTNTAANTGSNAASTDVEG